ncbi:MAG: bifunctional diaminohydroxyphosphoribosylaminopyrimidine deaminase/5-amino-6-(5-phosphoribosylamino)uracil reductase RibD [Geminicoccaceae bacterium]
MAMAMALAERGLGNVWPNPAVGCVLVRDGRVVGRGWTQPGGRPHAESEAIARAGEAARGSTAYVTLEPCAHHGRTPPCTELMLQAGIARVVVAAVDPDPRVNGKGIAILREGGVEVAVGCLEAEACRLNSGFFARMCRRRPFVALKLATSADGRIATASGESMWITGEAARAEGHRLRLRYDAILIGSGTALSDDPLLTCRLPGLEERSPVRVVLDRRLRLPPAGRLARSSGIQPVWLFTVDPAAAAAERLAAAGVTLHALPDVEEADQLADMLASLAEQGITRLLIEGGAMVATAFLRASLVDRIHLFTAPLLLGGDGVPALGPLGVRALADARRWHPVAARPVGQDRLLVLEPA